MAFRVKQDEFDIMVQCTESKIKVEFSPGGGEERAFIRITTPTVEYPLIVRVDGELVVNRS